MLSEARIEGIKRIKELANTRMQGLPLFHCATDAIFDLLAERKGLLARIEELEIEAENLLDPPVAEMEPKSVRCGVLSVPEQ